MSQLVDKYVWFKAIYAESRFPAGEKAVLGHIAIVNVFAGRDVFQVRQSTIAAQCQISRQTVSSAIGGAKRLGYLTVSDRRATGPGKNGADELRITLPPGVSQDALHQSEVAPSDVKQTAESCKANGPSDVKQTAESCKAPNSSSSENGTPNSSLEIVLEDSSLALEPELIDAEIVQEERGSERGRSDPVAVSASRLVSDLVPRTMPSTVTTGLRLAASQLIRGDGLPSEVVGEAIRRWLTRPGLGVPMLAHIASDVLREGTAPPPKSKQRDWAELLAEAREAEARAAEQAAQPARKALEQ